MSNQFNYPLSPKNVPHKYERGFMVTLVQTVVNLINGKHNATGTVTLRASQTTTTITDPRLTAGSVLSLCPLTANAATAKASVYVSSRDNGTMVLTHASNAAVDQTFDYSVAG